MKRVLLALAVATVLLAGCKRDELDDRRMETCLTAGGSYTSKAGGDFSCTLPGTRP